MLESQQILRFSFAVVFKNLAIEEEYLPSDPSVAPPPIIVFRICSLVSSAFFNTESRNIGTTDIDAAKFLRDSVGLSILYFLTKVSIWRHLFLLARPSMIITTFSPVISPRQDGISGKHLM